MGKARIFKNEKRSRDIGKLGTLERANILDNVLVGDKKDTRKMRAITKKRCWRKDSYKESCGESVFEIGFRETKSRRASREGQILELSLILKIIIKINPSRKNIFKNRSPLATLAPRRPTVDCGRSVAQG